MNYQDFQILVRENQKIRVSSEQGDISGELRLDMDRTNQTLRLIEHQVKDGELLKGLGYELYQALFPNEINARLQATIAGAQANNHNVRLRLIFESPQLAALPWEFLYDKQTNTFLGNNTQTVLSRYIDVPLIKVALLLKQSVQESNRQLKQSEQLLISVKKNRRELETQVTKIRRERENSQQELNTTRSELRNFKKQVKHSEEYITTVEKLAKLAGQLEDEGSDAEADIKLKVKS